MVICGGGRRRRRRRCSTRRWEGEVEERIGTTDDENRRVEYQCPVQ